MAGAHQGILQAGPLRPQVLDKVQHEDAVLGHDAHADDRAEERHHIQRRAGDPQPQHGAEHGQDRAKHDGQRLVKGAEFHEQDGEDQEDGQGQHQHQIAEGLLLLLEQPAILDGAGRDGLVQAQFLLDVRDGAAQIAPFETRRHRHTLAQVFAVQLQLAGGFINGGDLRELDQGAIRGAQRQLLQVRHPVNLFSVHQHPYGDDAVPLQHRGSGHAQHGGIDGRRHITGRQPKPFHLGVSRAQPQAGAGIDQPALGIHHPFDFTDLLLHFRRLLLQELEVGGEEFDFDGLRLRSQVADQVAQNAWKLPFDIGQHGVELGPQIGNDIQGGHLAPGLELDQKIPGVGFDDLKPQGRAGAAGIAFDVGVGADNFFGDQELAMGLGQARAPRRHIVNHETAFVHGRQELALQPLIDADAQEQHHRAGGQREPAMAQGRAQAELVEAEHARQQKTPFRVLGRAPRFKRLAVAQKPGGQ